MLPRPGPSNPSTALADNRRLVLNVLREAGEMTRTEIGEASGLSPAATARITDRLEAEKLIARTEKTPSGGGRPAWRYQFTATGRLLGGIRVQRDGARGALLSWDGQILSRSQVLLDPATATGEGILESARACTGLIEHEATALGAHLAALGVAVPAVADAEGRAGAGAEVGWHDVPLREELAKLTQVPLLVENDANALAYSELTPGGHTASLAGLILGHGLGAGLISDGHLLRGTHFAAGEIGYLITSRDVLSSPGGDIGDLELRIQRAARSGPFATDAPAQLWTLMGQSSPAAMEATAEMLDYLAMAIASLVVVVDPERVVIGDVPEDQAQRVLDELATRLRGHLLHEPTITTARRGPDAVLIGAALLAGELVDLQSI
ncbi:MAG TPA: ROK family transcriptional regulator [Propionicimonas sp.]